MSRLIRMGESVLRRLVGSKTLTISWITPYVAVGDEVDASLRSELLDAGITITVDVRKCFDESMNPIRSKIQAWYRDWETDRKSTRLNSSHSAKSRMPSSA